MPSIKIAFLTAFMKITFYYSIFILKYSKLTMIPIAFVLFYMIK
jgi:hypothetical protein